MDSIRFLNAEIENLTCSHFHMFSTTGKPVINFPDFSWQFGNAVRNQACNVRIAGLNPGRGRYSMWSLTSSPAAAVRYDGGSILI